MRGIQWNSRDASTGAVWSTTIYAPAAPRNVEPELCCSVNSIPRALNLKTIARDESYIEFGKLVALTYIECKFKRCGIY